jgi:hypothetical protein
MTFSLAARLGFMRLLRFSLLPLLCCGFLFTFSPAKIAAQNSKVKLDSIDGLELVNGKAEMATYRGRKAVHLMPLPGHELTDGSVFAILKGTDFKDGAIEVDLAGAPRPGADPRMKGFIGIAFRVQPHAEASEMFYLRPSNGRAPEQLTRNHAAQYVSDPDFTWQRLRQETPGKYESYVDLEPGVWTKIRIEVAGTKARLYVNGASQPCLIVNDLKRGESRGQIALWSHETTEAYFANLRVQ